MSQFRTKQFKDLKDSWYKKLEDSGFKDIETDESMLKWSATSQFAQSVKNNGVEGQEAAGEYYRVAGFFLHDNKFENKLYKSIWRLHSEGISIREIPSVLAKEGVNTTVARVRRILEKLRKKLFNVQMSSK